MNSILIEHMMNPQNYGVLENRNSEGIGKNPYNGEKVIIFLNIKDDIIEDISFQAIGCMTTVLAGSLITSQAKGSNLDRAQELVSATLGMLDRIAPEEAACSEIVALALQASIDTYKARQKEKDFPIITYKISQNCAPQNEEIIDE